MDVLAPSWGSYDDDGVWVHCPDSCNDRVCVALDLGPFNSIGLIADLVKHMTLSFVQSGDCGPERKRIRLRLPSACEPVAWVAGIQHVPIDDNIDGQLSA